MIVAESELLGYDLLGKDKKPKKKKSVQLQRAISKERYYKENPGKIKSLNDYFSSLKINPDQYKTLQEESNKANDEAMNKIILDSQKSKGYFSTYNPETKTIAVLSRINQFSDPKLDPVKDFKKFDNAVTEKIKETITDVVDPVIQPVKSWFEGLEWYWWLIIGAGALLGLYILVKLV